MPMKYDELNCSCDKLVQKYRVHACCCSKPSDGIVHFLNLVLNLSCRKLYFDVFSARQEGRRLLELQFHVILNNNPILGAFQCQHSSTHSKKGFMHTYSDSHILKYIPNEMRVQYCPCFKQNEKYVVSQAETHK